MELNGGTVETIFRRCLAMPCEGGLNWKLELDEKKIVKDKTLIRYLLGQLRLVHQGCYEFGYDEDLVRHYSGDIWSEDGKYDEQVHMLLKLGMKVECLNWRTQDGKTRICLNRDMVFSTFAQRDPAFTGWWDIHEPYFQAQGFFQHRSDKTPEDAQRILDYYRQGTEKGDPWAQNKLASVYWFGVYGLPEDPAEAFRLYSLSAEAGIPDSCSRLAYCYAFGEGTSQDYEAAIHWYYRAYQNGASSRVMMDFHHLANTLYELVSKFREEKDQNLYLRYLKLAEDALEKDIEFLKAIMDEPARDFNHMLSPDGLNLALKTADNMLGLLHIQAVLDGLE